MKKPLLSCALMLLLLMLPLAGCVTAPAPLLPMSVEAPRIPLLADMSGRLDEAAGILAEYAQAARNAGQQCVSNYEALTHE